MAAPHSAQPVMAALPLPVFLLCYFPGVSDLSKQISLLWGYCDF